ncbi:aconitase X catalytic domain-containing protein [Candidatus Micrarchaeota archaeon]|nr:aconitase X catalytic domain-containing protein [Candidatus Micrarchaeota archaeon]
MELTRDEEAMLHGKYGGAKQKAMEILLALGKIYGASRMIKVTSAQIAGVSYKTIGDAGLEYLKHMAALGGRVEIPSFLNPAGMDTEQWEELGVPEDFAKKQIEILDAYSTMGISTTCTCTPYLCGIRPAEGEHVAWSESSAVSFANSVLGARTNREGGPSALCAALCGATPLYGLHLEENRVARLIVRVEGKLENRADYGLLGLLVGREAKGRIPAFIFGENTRGAGGGCPKTEEGCGAGCPKHSISESKLKYLGAAMAASGSVPLYFVKGVTPEWRVDEGAEEIVVSQGQIMELKAKLNEADEADLITVGCPHASIEELEEIAQLLERKPVKKPFWICLGRSVKKEAQDCGIAERIERGGGKLVADTCMVVSPLEEMGFSKTAIDSGKASVYLPTMCKQKLLFGKLEEILWK